MLADESRVIRRHLTDVGSLHVERDDSSYRESRLQGMVPPGGASGWPCPLGRPRMASPLLFCAQFPHIELPCEGQGRRPCSGVHRARYAVHHPVHVAVQGAVLHVVGIQPAPAQRNITLRNAIQRTGPLKRVSTVSTLQIYTRSLGPFQKTNAYVRYYVKKALQRFNALSHY